MSRYYSQTKMLRMTPNRLLREFFDHLGYRLLALDWRKLKERDVQALMIAIGLLPDTAQLEIEAALAAVFELACAGGSQQLWETAHGYFPLTATRFPRNTSAYHLAMWAWMHCPELFERAQLAFAVKQLGHWHRRKSVPCVEPRTSNEALAELAAGVSQFLRREEGRGQRCTVDHYRRGDGVDVFVAFPDDFVQTVSTHDQRGRLVPRVVKPTFEIVFRYDRRLGMLDLHAQMAPILKARLEGLFGQIVLGVDVDPFARELPHDLDRLKDRYFCLATDPADAVDVSIDRMRLDVRHEARVTVEPLRKRRRDIYDVIDDCLGEQVRWEDVQITQAALRFVFAATPRRRATVVRCDVTHPDRCTIRTQRPDCIEVIRKYLERWRIAHV
jgi:hypothetical protein